MEENKKKEVTEKMKQENIEKLYQIKMDRLVLSNIDNATKFLKVAKGYGTQYFNNFIPKNAIYGRLTQNIYVYCKDFDQFKLTHNRTLFDVYVMDTRQDTQFRKVLIKKYSPLYNLLYAYIDWHNMYDVRIEYCLHIKDVIDKDNCKVRDTTIRKFNCGMNFVKTTIASRSSRHEIPLDFAEGLIAHTMVTKTRTK